MRVFPFLPAITAAVTDVVTSVVFIAYLQPHQPPGLEYPIQLKIYQFAMVGVALLLACPKRWLWLPAFLLLIGGVILAGFSVGALYIPTAAVAGWVMVRRLESSNVDQPV
jgi:hypothetical protein